MNFLPLEKYYPHFLVLLAFVLYGNSLFNKYSFDDKLVTSIHPQVQKGIKGIPEIFSTNYASGYGDSFEYRPVTKATYAVEYELFGESPAISHLVNVLLYCFTCLLLYRITVSLFISQGSSFVFVAVLFFLVHPTHTEVVSSLKNREEILTFLFCLMSLVFFIKSVKQNNLYFFIPALLFYTLSLFTKLTALPFLLLIPMCLYFVGAENYRLPLRAFLAILSVTMIFLAGIFVFLPGTYNREVYFIENAIVAENSVAVIFLNALQTMWLYIKLCIFPHPLSFYYGYDVFPVAKKISPEIVISFLLHGFMVIYSIVKIWKRDILAFAFLFYLINMSMYFNLVFPAPGIIADRALYVSSYGFSILIAFILTKFFKKKIVFFCAPLVLLASFKTISRNSDWKNSLTLMSKDIKHLGRSAKANMEYASVLRDHWENEKDTAIKEKYAQKAIYYFRESLKIKPDMAIPYNETGKILFHHYHNYAEAKENFLKAVENLDTRAEYHFNLATAYAFLGDSKNAETYFLKTIQINPDDTKAFHNLFLVYMAGKNFESAYRINTKLLEKAAEEVYPYFNFGNYFLAVGDTTNAIRNFEKARSIDANSSEIRSVLESLEKRSW